MNAEMIGIIIGIFLGLAFCVVIFKTANKDKKVKTEYDERQEAIRGKSYKYGFYTAMIYLAILTVLFIADIPSPFVISIEVFFGICLSSLVVEIHSIWNNAYWGLNNNKGRYYIVLAIITIINLGVGIKAIIEGTLLIGHQVQMINLLCGIMLLIVILTMIIKSKVCTKQDFDEEE